MGPVQPRWGLEEPVLLGKVQVVPGLLEREQVATVGPVRVVQPVELGQLQRGWVLAQGCTPSSSVPPG